MAEPISIQQLKDASEDAISLAEFINKPENAMIPRRLASDIHSLQYYLEYMKSFAQRSYETYNEMVTNSSNLSENVSVFVTNDSDTSKNGIYTYNGTSFVKGDYQPENAAKEFVEAKLGSLEVFDGKVRAQDVRTVDGSTQDTKNTEFRNALDALPFEDGVLADTFVTVRAGSGGKVTRTLREKNSDNLSVKDFGAIGDGTLHTVAEWLVLGSRIYYASLEEIQVDYPHVTSLQESIDWVAIQAGINTKTAVEVPKGKYCVNRVLIMRRGFALLGEGVRTSSIISYVKDSPLFILEKDFIFGVIKGFDIRADSSITNIAEHCFELMGDSAGDVDGDSTSHSPQHLELINLEITGFNGKGTHPQSKDKTLPSCGILQSKGIGTRVTDVICNNNQIGMFFSGSSTTRIDNCTTTYNKYWGIFTYDNVNIIITRGNYISSGSATPSEAELNIKIAGETLPYTGQVMLLKNTGAVYSFNKSKGTKSTADIVALGGDGVFIDKNTIRGSFSESHDAYQGILCNQHRGINITENYFHGVNIVPATTSETATYKGVTVMPNSLYHATSGNISNNYFRGITASTVSYYIGLIGSSSIKRVLFSGMTIEGNQLGNDNRTADWHVSTGILVKQCQLKNSSIQRNTAYKPLKLTIDSVVNFDDVVEIDNHISGNSVYYGTTTPTNVSASDVPVYIGVDPDSRSFTQEFTARTIAANTSVDVIVPTVGVVSTRSYFVDASLTKPLNGSLVSSWVSANNEVTVRLSNVGSTPIELDKGFLNIKVRRASRSDLAIIS